MIETDMRRRIFSEGERVLCYEPDPTRLRVLYDAKILHVSRGDSEAVEYFIHFLGWSSSWDRYISEKFLLEDNAENREQQRLLSAEANKLLPKKRKKGNESSSTVSESSRDSSDEESEEESICQSFSLPLPPKLTERLRFEGDHLKSGQVHKLPFARDIVSILEGYVEHYAFQIRYVRSTSEENNTKRSHEEGVNRLNDLELCKETVDGLRIVFNQLCRTLLLYKCEVEQFSRLDKIVVTRKASVDRKPARRTREVDLLLAQLEDSFLADKIPQAWDNETHRGRSLRVSTQHASIASGTLKRDDDSDSATITSWVSNSPCGSVRETREWRMEDDVESPARICGAFHLVRLLSRLPQIVPHLKMPLSKSQALKKHLKLLIGYLSDNAGTLFETEFIGTGTVS